MVFLISYIYATVRSRPVRHVPLLFAYPIPLPISAPPRRPDAENKRTEFFWETLGDSQSAGLPAPLAHLLQNNSPSQLASC